MGHLHPGDRDDRDICECNAMPIPSPVSPEVDDGCNGPTSLVRQQLIDFLRVAQNQDREDLADDLLDAFVIMKRYKDVDGGV